MIGRRLAVAVALVLAVVGCSSDDGGSDGPLADAGKAACVDLRAGMSLFQVASSGLDAGMSRKQVASSLILGIEDHCPEFLDELRASAIYTDWINE